MKFEWDSDKSDTCFKERGFDFAYALKAFLDPKRIVRKDSRWSYGEDRYQLLGAIELGFCGSLHDTQQRYSNHFSA